MEKLPAKLQDQEDSFLLEKTYASYQIRRSTLEEAKEGLQTLMIASLELVSWRQLPSTIFLLVPLLQVPRTLALSTQEPKGNLKNKNIRMKTLNQMRNNLHLKGKPKTSLSLQAPQAKLIDVYILLFLCNYTETS